MLRKLFHATSRRARTMLAFALAATVTLASTPLVAHAETASSVDKAETVYVYADAAGTVQSVSVKDILANDAAADEVVDRTSLTALTSSTDTSYTTREDGTIAWQAEGDEVQYKGTSTDTPPLAIHVTYKLDGKDVTPRELAGKSGHVEMTYAFTNDSCQTELVNGRLARIYTPFVAVTSLTLDRDVFSNVRVENAKITDGANSLTVIGYALPGLAESLDLCDEDISLPDSFTITADVEGFALGSATTIVTPELLSDLDTSDLDTGELKDALCALQNAMDQLVLGSTQLTEALRQITQGQSSLESGIAAFKTQATTLNEATGTLAEGADALATGIGGAETGADELEGYAQSATDLSAGAVSSMGTAAEQLSSVAEQLGQAGTAVELAMGASSALANTVTEELLARVQDAAVTAQDAATTLSGQAGTLTAARDALAAIDRTGLSEEQVANLDAAISALDASLALDLEGVASKLGAAHEALGQVSPVDTSALDEQLASIAGSLGTAQEDLAGAGTSLTDAATGVGTAQAVTAGVTDGLTELKDGLSDAHDGAVQLSEGIAQLDQSMPTVIEGLDSLKGGAAQLTSALTAATDGSSTLSSGLAQMNCQGISELADTFDGDITGLTERLKAVTRAAGSYQNFAGIAEGATGSVTFIYKLDGIGE